ncbi:recombination regulator RecX [Anaerobacillus alkalidiazotrophicus]|uniref:recombination regulator RecX n=1 Tax=Anaerobacillus alkalidiazotrophicus TaxID=472963 RepID=UPI000A743CE1|nr:recombination regulator RecX [Anaerobacillus alkalidiazotrophicus]
MDVAVISKITTQKKNLERYNIFLDDGHGEQYAFSVDQGVLVTFQLRKGLEITKELLTEITHEEMIRKGYHHALNYLSYRMRSKKEVIDYLIKKEFDKEVISIVVDRLIEEKYINDAEFSNAFVRSRINLTNKGPELVKKELIEKGISNVEITESLKMYTFEDQIEKASTLLLKKNLNTKRTSRTEYYNKMKLLLLSKGFTYEIAQHALQKLIEETVEDFDAEWDAVTYQGEKALRKYKNEDGWEKKKKIKQYLYRRGFTVDLIEKFIEEFV